MTRGVLTIDDLRARSTRSPGDLCWHWVGAMTDGRPKIWTVDPDLLTKRVMSGARAVWYIAHGTKLGTGVAYMNCFCRDCVCPAHVSKARSRGEFNRVLGLAGLLKHPDGATPAMIEAGRRGRAAQGMAETPPEVVLQIRARGASESTAAIGRSLGLHQTTVARILAGKTHRSVGVPE